MLQLILYQNLNFLDLKGEKMKFLFQHFFELLSNINVSIENFCNHLEHYKRSERDDFLVNLSPNFYSLNIKGLEVIKNEQQKLFEKSGEKTHKINTIMVQGL